MLERLQQSIDRPCRIPPGDVIPHSVTSHSLHFHVCDCGYKEDWSIDAPPPDGLVFIGVKRGSSWLVVEGAREPIHVQTGDCYLVKSGHAYRHAVTFH